MPLLLILFIAVPLAEIYTFIKVGELIGAGWTIAIVILTAIAGTALLRLQGLATLERANEALRKGQLPIESVIDGVGLLIAGALLLTPGILTDIAGFALFIPPVRHGLARLIFNRIKQSSRVEVHFSGFSPRNTPPHQRPDGGGNAAPQSGPIIEGEAVEIDPAPPKQPDRRVSAQDSPWRRYKE